MIIFLITQIRSKCVKKNEENSSTALALSIKYQVAENTKIFQLLLIVQKQNLSYKIKREKRRDSHTPPIPPQKMSCSDHLYLASEEWLGSWPTILIVDEFEKEEVEECDERCHTEPEKERQARVLFSHVVLVSQDGLHVHGVPQVLKVSEISGDVQ